VESYANGQCPAEPRDPPTFTCAADRRPVTLLERQAAFFAAAFLIPEADIIAAMSGAGPARSFRALLADEHVVEATAETFLVPTWVAEYRLHDLATCEQPSLHQRRN
jgi:Zn-dependent peptidase ImmA (M78 family)